MKTIRRLSMKTIRRLSTKTIRRLSTKTIISSMPTVQPFSEEAKYEDH